MRTFEEFLQQHGNVPERSRPHYVRWVGMFSGFIAREQTKNEEQGEIGEHSGRRNLIQTGSAPGKGALGVSAPTVQQIERFMSFLEKRYEIWQVQQARRALQLYSYYAATLTAGTPGRAPAHPAPSVAADWDAAETVITRLMRLQHYSLTSEHISPG